MEQLWSSDIKSDNQFYFNMRSLIVIVISLLFATSCSSDNILESQSEPSATNAFDQIMIGYLDFKLSGSLKKQFKSGIGQNELSETGCDKWIFEDEALINIIKSMRKVEYTEAYKLCYQYPCWYEGKAVNGDIEYEIVVYSSSYITLHNDEETIHFIMEVQSDLFTTPCDCCEYD